MSTPTNISIDMEAVGNVSDIDLKWSDPYKYLDGQIGLKVFLTLYGCFVLSAGTFMSGILICYEKFGGDPMKRGLSNQLLTQVWIVVIICYWLTLPIMLWRTLDGPYQNEMIFWARWGITNFMFFMTIISFTEFYMIKFLFIVVKKRMLAILDDFWSRFLFCSNAAASVLPTYLSMFNQNMYNRFPKFQGLPGFLAKTPVFEFRTAFAALAFAVIMTFIGCSIKLAKWKTKVAIVPNQGPVVNNVKHNKDLVALGRAFLLGMFVIGGFFSRQLIFAYIELERKEVHDLASEIFYDLFHPTVAIIFSPFTIIVSNPGLKSFIKKSVLC